MAERRPLTWGQVLEALKELTPQQLETTACIFMGDDGGNPADGIKYDLYDHFLVSDSGKDKTFTLYEKQKPVLFRELVR